MCNLVNLYTNHFRSLKIYRLEYKLEDFIFIFLPSLNLTVKINSIPSSGIRFCESKLIAVGNFGAEKRNHNRYKKLLFLSSLPQALINSEKKRNEHILDINLQKHSNFGVLYLCPQHKTL